MVLAGITLSKLQVFSLYLWGITTAPVISMVLTCGLAALLSLLLTTKALLSFRLVLVGSVMHTVQNGRLVVLLVIALSASFLLKLEILFLIRLAQVVPAYAMVLPVLRGVLVVGIPQNPAQRVLSLLSMVAI